MRAVAEKNYVQPQDVKTILRIYPYLKMLPYLKMWNLFKKLPPLPQDWTIHRCGVSFNLLPKDAKLPQNITPVSRCHSYPQKVKAALKI